MERLLVTSIDHYLGGNLALALAERCEVLALYDSCPLESPALRTAAWHPGDLAALETHLDQWQPQWILHCGPLSAPHWDPAGGGHPLEREPQLAVRLAQLAQRFGSRLSVISSDAVFAGPRMFHDEASPADNPAPRAQLARQVESALEHSEALVVRTHAYGWNFADESAGFAQRACEALLGRPSWETLAIDGRRHATPILATDLAELLWRAYQGHLSGLYHLAGAERTSPFRFVAELASVLGLSTDAVPGQSFRVEPGCEDETSLSSKLARRLLATSTPMLRDGLLRFAEQAHNGWRSQWTRIDCEAAVVAA